jgi:transcriptional regulator NrdR family protein
MLCSICKFGSSEVVSSKATRTIDTSMVQRRTRRCRKCQESFVTLEVLEDRYRELVEAEQCVLQEARNRDRLVRYSLAKRAEHH